MMNVEEPASPDTLLVRRLPDELTERDLNDLFRGYFGAVEVRREKRLSRRNSNVYIKFLNPEDASYAMNRLHQLIIRGKRIVVEYADFTFLSKLSSDESIQPDTDYEGNYPPINEATAKNISDMLLRDASFYHKVIQIMRSMNLRPPFSACEEHIDQQEIEEVEMEELYKEETEESELEPDDSLGFKEIIPQLPAKRKKLKQLTRRHKIQPVILKSKETAKDLPLTEVFERREINPGKKLQVRIPDKIPEPENVALPEGQVEGFGKFAPVPVPEEPGTSEEKQPEEESMEFISKVKLSTNVITPEEMKLLPVFKNYAAGDPSSRLYIKNLAKGTKEEDLRFIYGRFVMWTSEEERYMFDIRLMTEGRMKGQAFITLPSVKRAEQALKDTNGYVLNGKPLVVHFARSAVKPQSK